MILILIFWDTRARTGGGKKYLPIFEAELGFCTRCPMPNLVLFYKRESSLVKTLRQAATTCFLIQHLLWYYDEKLEMKRDIPLIATPYL